uniref:Cohesin subunit SA-2 n=1 Tax=Mesocestoides corti TaxID=53468 RepID=A0A5K3F4T3_MESCO
CSIVASYLLRSYNYEWKIAQSCLEELLLTEPNEKTKPTKDPRAAFVVCAKLFVRYIQIFRTIEKCYDQIVHPQKRLL